MKPITEMIREARAYRRPIPLDTLPCELAKQVEVYRSADGVLRTRPHSHKIDMTDSLKELYDNVTGECEDDHWTVTVNDFVIEQGPDGRIYFIAETVEVDEH